MEKEAIAVTNDLNPINAVLERSQNSQYPPGERGPSREQLEGSRQAHGQVFCTILGNGAVYVIRKLGRKKYRNLMKMNKHTALEIQKLENPQEQQDKLEELEMEQEERTATACLLFPTLSASDLANGDAGIPGTLTEMILQINGFSAVVTPQLIG